MSWKAVLRFATLVVLVFLAKNSYAQGSCPSTANMDGGVYAAPSHCYYVDFSSGSDSNSGTSESSPLKHAKGMQGCSGNCSAMSLGGGIGVIFRGGVTWDYTIWPWAPGASGSGGSDSSGGCTGSSCLYLGVDKSWFAGGSWSRPVFSGGDFSNPGANTTCFYDMDNSSGPRMLDLVARTDLIVDNFELTGMCLQSPNNPPGGNNPPYINTGGAQNLTIENTYIHRVAWPLSYATQGQAFEAVNGGSYHFTYNVIDYSDSGPTTTFTSGCSNCYSGDGIGGGNIWMDHNVLHNLGDSTDIGSMSVHDNYFWNAAAGVCEGVGCGFHNHISNDSACTAGTTITWYNNVVDTTYAQTLGFADNAACTYYVFNNVFVNQINAFTMFATGQNGNKFYIFNNTAEAAQDGGPSGAFLDGGGTNASYQVFNDHIISGNGGGVFLVGAGGNAFDPAGSWTTSAGTITHADFNSLPGYPLADIIVAPQSTANSQGYSRSQTYMFSPTSSGGPTVGKGVNEMNFCNTLNSATGDSAAFSACKHDTSYAVAYNQTNHTAINGPRVPNARPTTGAWDSGAYQFSSASSSAPLNPPSGLTAVVQ